MFFSRHIGNLQGHFCGIFTREDEILYDIKFSIKLVIQCFYQKYKVLQNGSEWFIEVIFYSYLNYIAFHVTSALKSYLEKRLLTKYKSIKHVNIRNHRVFRFVYRTFMNLRLCVFSPKKDFHVHRL